MRTVYDSQHPYEVLRQGAEHKVVFCYECQLYHVYFGTMSLDLSDFGMNMFLQSLASHLTMYEGVTDPQQRCIEVAMPMPGIRPLLSVEDIIELSALLTDARQEFEERLRLRRMN